MQNGRRMVVVDGVRTPFCRMGTALSEMTADDLGATAVKALLADTGIDPGIIDEVIMGCCGQPAEAMNVGRVVSLRAGIPDHVPAITVHRNCASGCESITLAYEKMCGGVGDVFVVGGCEAMSQAPLHFSQSAQKKFGELGKAKTLPQKVSAMASFRPADFAPRIGLVMGLTDPVSGLGMGMTAEVVGRENGITREMADEFSLQSHQKAIAARERLREEITTVYAPPKFKAVEDDNGPREGQSMQALAKLKPVFERKTGTVTAGNASQITDGAVALLVMSEEKAEALGYEPLAMLVGYAYAGCDPARMGLGPVYAMAKAEKQSGWKLADAELIELNEAFAAQALACMKLVQDEKFCRNELNHDGPLGEFPEEITNVNGGAIALGHPVGCSGSRISLTLMKEMQRRGLKRGVATMCVGGGQGSALWFERP